MQKYNCTPEMRDRLYAIRNALGLSQRAMGKQMGFSYSYYGNLELRLETISEKTVIAICSVYHVRREYLLKGEEPMFDDGAMALAKLTRIYNAMDDSYRRCLLEYSEYLFFKNKRERADKK